MGKFTARTLSRSDLNAALKFIRTRNNELIRLVQGDPVARALLNGCQIIEARAKEILTEKGHVRTGTLRRSINSQVRLRAGRLEGEVGSFVHYAPYVEALPPDGRPPSIGPRGGEDPGRGKGGGYLNPAAEEKFGEVRERLEEQGIKPVLVRWGR